MTPDRHLDVLEFEAARKHRRRGWGALFVLVTAGCIVGAVFYAIFVHDHDAAPRAARAPAPGAVPLPDGPSTTTGQRAPLPGDRATGTVIGPDVKTAPPPLAPARPITPDAGAAPGNP